jgi:hypothetical protein
LSRVQAQASGADLLANPGDRLPEPDTMRFQGPRTDRSVAHREVDQAETAKKKRCRYEPGERSHDLGPPARRAALTVTGIDEGRHHNSCDQRRDITRHSKRHGDDIVTKGYTEILKRGQGYLSPPLSILSPGKIKPHWACLISLKALDGLARYHCCRIGGDTSPDSGGPSRMVDDHRSDRGRHSLRAC